MAYTVSDGLNYAKKTAKGLPLTGIDVTACDMVSSAMYRYYPWRDTLKVFTPVALTDGTQDFATGLTDIFRITQFWINQTDVSPTLANDITVASNLKVDLVPRSPWQVRSAAYQPGINEFRLECAVRIPTGSVFTLCGEYQPRHTKLTDVKDPLWFQDEFLEIFTEGMCYRAMVLADDSRAGTAEVQENGGMAYTGQLAVFMARLRQMAQSEDFGTIDGYYPSDSLGAVDGRRWYSNDLFPFFTT